MNKYRIDNEVAETNLTRGEEKNLEFVPGNYTEGIDFHTDRWKIAFQKNRKLLCRTTWHGYHHWLCMSEKCFAPDECVCTFCGEVAIGRYHVLECGALRQESIAATIKDLSELKSSLKSASSVNP